MDHLARVRVRDRLAHLREHRHEAPVIPGIGGEQVGEGVPLDELHHQERAAVGQRAEVVDRRDAGVLELAGDSRLGEEAACDGRVGRIAILEELDGDVAVEREVAGAVDDAHPAAADDRTECVAGNRDGLRPAVFLVARVGEPGGLLRARAALGDRAGWRYRRVTALGRVPPGGLSRFVVSPGHGTDAEGRPEWGFSWWWGGTVLAVRLFGGHERFP